MKRIIKLVLCLVISLLLATSAISVYAVNGAVDNKQSEETIKAEIEKHMLEEIASLK